MPAQLSQLMVAIENLKNVVDVLDSTLRRELVAHIETSTARGDGACERSRLLRPEEAAEHLGISRTKLYELMRSGELLSLDIGSARRVPMGAIIDYVDHSVTAKA